MTSPSAGLPKTFSSSLEKTQSCPCKIRARGRTTIPAITTIVGQPGRLPNAGEAAVSGGSLNTRFWRWGQRQLQWQTGAVGLRRRAGLAAALLKPLGELNVLGLIHD